jgi:hypothetical protein
LQAAMLGEKTVDQAVADAAQEWDSRSWLSFGCQIWLGTES